MINEMITFRLPYSEFTLLMTFANFEEHDLRKEWHPCQTPCKIGKGGRQFQAIFRIYLVLIVIRILSVYNFAFLFIDLTEMKQSDKSNN